MLTITKIDEDNTLERVKSCLLSGGVVVLPTETVYGLVTLWSNEAGRERIYELKHRPPEKRLQMLAGSLEQAINAGVRVSADTRKLAAQFWPGALTLILPANEGRGDTVGLRIPAHDFLQKLLAILPEPLAATSANLSGRPPASNATEAIAELCGEPEMVIDGGQCTVTGGQASSVISLTGEQPLVLREGAVTLEQIKAALI